MKRLFAVLAVFLLAGSLAAQGIVWFEGSLEQAMQKAETENKFLLINFFTGSG
jgi:hypothetical protein